MYLATSYIHMKSIVFIWLFLITLSPAQAVEVSLTNHPGNFRVYSWSEAHTNNMRQTSSSRQFNELRLEVPESHLVYDGEQLNLIATLRSWKNDDTLSGEGHPQSGTSFNYFPFQSSEGETFYIALERLLESPSNSNIQIQTGITPLTATPAVPLVANIELQTCEEKQQTVLRYRNETNIAPESTTALHQCLIRAELIGRLQQDREVVATINQQRRARGLRAQIITPSSPRPRMRRADLVPQPAERQVEVVEGEVCGEEMALVNHHRTETNIAPQSTRALHACYDAAGRGDLKTQDIARLRVIDTNRVRAGLPLRYHDANSIDGALFQLNVWRSMNIQQLRCNRDSLNDTATCAVCNCWAESNVASELDKYLVVRSILGRMASRHYPSRFCSVVKQPSQYSWVGDSQYNLIENNPNPHQRCSATSPRNTNIQNSLQKCISASLRALSEPVNENTPDHYHATYVQPNWSQTCRRRLAVTNQLEGGGTGGFCNPGHYFFRSPCPERGSQVNEIDTWQPPLNWNQEVEQ